MTLKPLGRWCFAGLLTLLAVGAAPRQQGYAPAQPVYYVARLTLETRNCADSLQPFTHIEVVHRSHGAVVATYVQTSSASGIGALDMPNFQVGDSACVSVLPPGGPHRDSGHVYKYLGPPPLGGPVSGPGVWDLGSSLVAICADDKYVDPSGTEIIICRYRF